MPLRFQVLSAILLLSISASISVAEKEKDGGFAISESEHGVVVTVDGKSFAEYVVDQANKPFLFPVYGPTGDQMTRAFPMQVVEGEDPSHPHHRGITFGHQSIGGVDTWTEQATWDEFLSRGPKFKGLVESRSKDMGRIRHCEFTKLQADQESALVVAVCEYLDASGKKVLAEERRMIFHANDLARMIDINQDLIASEGPVRFVDIKDAGLSIRVPTSMSVSSKLGGTIVNSEGDRDGKTWSKAASWCDYSGPVGVQPAEGDSEVVGIAVLNHPSSFRYPTRWHSREYGLLTANPFASKKLIRSLPDMSFNLEKGEQISLRHRFIFHTGSAEAANIARAFHAYSEQSQP